MFLDGELTYLYFVATLFMLASKVRNKWNFKIYKDVIQSCKII